MDQIFRKTVAKFPNMKSFGTREILYQKLETLENGKPIKKILFGDYQWMSYTEADARVENMSKGLRALGVEPCQHVLIYAETRFEWLATAHACFRLNAVVVTLYPTLGDDEIVHGINDSDVDHLVTSISFLPKLKNMLPKIPKVKYIIYMEDDAYSPVKFPEDIQLVAFSQLERLGTETTIDVGDNAPKPEDNAMIMYTSGSTGIPKGVLMTHKNLMCMVTAYANCYRGNPKEDIYVAYLPLSHIFELSAECSLAFIGIRIGYSSPLTLTDKSPSIIGNPESVDAKENKDMLLKFQHCSCRGDVMLLRPTVMFAVPYMLDKIRKAITDGSRAKGPLASMLFEFSVKYKSFWMSNGFQTPILNRLIFRGIRELFGGRVRFMVCGGAPLSEDTHNFVKVCLDTIIIQAYGLTENTGGVTCMHMNDPRTGTIGPPMIGAYVKLVNWEEGDYHVTDLPHPRGEIVMGGEFVTAGYYKNQELTNEVFHQDEAGMRWFYSGDIGQLQPNGTFKIIDRKKDLVKLPFGEYIALGKIEAELKCCPLVESICIYGSCYQTYLVALVMPDKNQLKELAKKLHREHLSHADLCGDPIIVDEFMRLLREFGVKCHLKGLEIPKKIHLCSEDWTPDSGFLTAALKLRRRVIQNFYQSVIDRLYET